MIVNGVRQGWLDNWDVGMDEIVSPALDDGSEDFLRRIEKLSLRRGIEHVGDATSVSQEAKTQTMALGLQLGFPGLSGKIGERQSGASSSTEQEGRGACGYPEEVSEVEMDINLWGELPDHVIDNILAKLPVLSFLRLRTVCKKWNSLASNPSFLENCSRVRDKVPLFLLYADHTRQRYPTYDPALNSWYLLPQNCSFPGKSLSSFAVVAAAGGLLCLAEENGPTDHNLNLYVFNPMTKGRRRIPTPTQPMPNPYVVGMVMDSMRKAYKILMAQNGEFLTLQVYDSSSNSWQMSDSIRKRLALLVGTAFTQGILYCLSYGMGVHVSAYHVERGTLEDLLAPMPAALVWPELFVSRGHLRMVGAIADYGVICNICIWQLDSVQMEWVHVLSVPEHLLQELTRGHCGSHCFFVADGDYICFARYQVKRILMCNLFKKSWWWLPLCPSEEYVDELSFSGFPLQPSLDASV